MKRIFASIFIVLLVNVASAFADMTAQEIMEKQGELHGSESEMTNETMILKDKRGGSKQRGVQRYFKEINEDESRGLLVFNSPNDVRGTALLTWGRADSSDQWLYIPASKRLQRMDSGSNKKKYFMGTDFTYEDLSGEDTDDFDYEIEGEETFKGNDCWIISAVPANDNVAKESGYSRRMIWVRKDIYFTVKIEFYEAVRPGSTRTPRMIKTQLGDQFENVSGSLWRAKRTVMDNHLNNHQTFVVIQDRKINEAMDDIYFTERYLTSRRHMQ